MLRLEDIINAEIPVLTHGLQGKKIFIYGQGGLGKSKQLAKLPSPIHLACENTDIYGIPQKQIQNWADFEQAIELLCEEPSMKKCRETFKTIIVDGVDALSQMMTNYICNTHLDGALDLGDVDRKKIKVNGYKVCEKTAFDILGKLLTSPYTVAFIGHGKLGKTNTKKKSDDVDYPAGEKRVIELIVNNCPIVGYVLPLGEQGEDKKYLNSTINLFNDSDFFAKCRFPEVKPTFEFTLENLNAELALGIEKEEKLNNVKSFSFEDVEKQKEKLKAKESFKESIDKIFKFLDIFEEKDTEENKLISKAEIIRESVLGKGLKISELTERNAEAVNMILFKLTNLAEEYNISIDTATE